MQHLSFPVRPASSSSKMPSSARSSTRTRKKTQRLQDSQDSPQSISVPILVGPPPSSDHTPPLPPLPRRESFSSS
ncbi:hypothetical protein JCM5353_002101 [Sporobolomyces roseus]